MNALIFLYGEVLHQPLGEHAKGDRGKVKIAVRLRRQTLVTVAWIAERLRMGSVAKVNTLFYHWRQGKE